MDEDIPRTVVVTSRQEKQTPHILQVVRNGDWTIEWRPATSPQGPLHTFCSRCSTGVVVHSSRFQPDRVTHSCPHSGRAPHEAELSHGVGPPSSDGDTAYWQAFVGDNLGGEEEGEGG